MESESTVPRNETHLMNAKMKNLLPLGARGHLSRGYIEDSL